MEYRSFRLGDVYYCDGIIELSENSYQFISDLVGPELKNKAQVILNELQSLDWKIVLEKMIDENPNVGIDVFPIQSNGMNWYGTRSDILFNKKLALVAVRELGKEDVIGIDIVAQYFISNQSVNCLLRNWFLDIDSRRTWYRWGDQIRKSIRRFIKITLTAALIGQIAVNTESCEEKSQPKNISASSRIEDNE